MHLKSKNLIIDKKPNFFIVGAAKAGTTSLWRLLKQHPEIYMPENLLFKEPAFFSDKQQLMTFQQYLALFADASDPKHLIGEASTCYLACPSSAQRIYQFNPHAKIIIILRNPIDRAYSLYNWMVQEGYEYSSTFEVALQREEKRISKSIPNFFEPEYYWNYMYFRSGLYFQQVKKYMDLFGDNVLVIKFDSFVSSLLDNYKKICFFLGVKTNHIDNEKHNRSTSVYSPLINFSLRKIISIVSVVQRQIIGKEVYSKESRDFFGSLGMRKSRPRPMLPETTTMLTDKFKNDMFNLSTLIQLNIDDWYSKQPTIENIHNSTF